VVRLDRNQKIRACPTSCRLRANQEMIDLCYQTLALADSIGNASRKHSKERERILSSSAGPDGQWSMRFDPAQPEVDFKLGTPFGLAARRHTCNESAVREAIDYLLAGAPFVDGWTPSNLSRISYPFRKRKWPFLLSRVFPELAARTKGWDCRWCASRE